MTRIEDRVDALEAKMAILTDDRWIRISDQRVMDVLGLSTGQGALKKLKNIYGRKTKLLRRTQGTSGHWLVNLQELMKFYT